MQIRLMKQLHLSVKQKHQYQKKMMKVGLHLQKLTKTTLVKEVQKQGVVFQELLWLKKKTASKEAERVALEDTWKRKDSRPHIPEFTSKSLINAELSDDPTPLDFLDLFLDEGFYKYLATQTNLYTSQYLQANPNLLPHSRFQKWKDIFVTEMKQFIALYLLTGIIR